MHHAANAYAKVSRAAMTPREAEAAVLIKAASRLQAMRGPGLAASPGLSEALTFNQRVWAVLAAAVADPANPLPDEIRAGVTRLSVFVFRTVLDAMIAPTPHKLDLLISLNRQLAAGLQGDPGTAG